MFSVYIAKVGGMYMQPRHKTGRWTAITVGGTHCSSLYISKANQVLKHLGYVGSFTHENKIQFR